jgi:UDP-glucose 4-epimerase
MIQPRTAIVTGCLGFLGSSIVRELTTGSWAVHGLDRSPLDPENGIADFLRSYRQQALPGPTLGQWLTDLSPAMVIHAAGPASVPASIANPLGDFTDSVAALYQLLEDLRRHSPESRLVFLSSAAVYGDPVSLPVSEGAPRTPLSPYGFHKQLCEQLLEESFRRYGLHSCSARIFSAYGPGLRRQVLWDFCGKARRNREVCLFGEGNESRDFIHARDIARALATLTEHARFEAEQYNVASGSETCIRDLTRLLADALGERTEVIFDGRRRAGDPLRWCADISRIRSLGFSPQVSLQEGVCEYARWYLDQGRDGHVVQT